VISSGGALLSKTGDRLRDNGDNGGTEAEEEEGISIMGDARLSETEGVVRLRKDGEGGTMVEDNRTCSSSLVRASGCRLMKDDTIACIDASCEVNWECTSAATCLAVSRSRCRREI